MHECRRVMSTPAHFTILHSPIAMTTIDVNPAVALCVERAQQHQALAADASTDEERRAHEATMRALDKAAMELVKGNVPRYAGSGMWLVESRTQANTVYRVDLTTQMCSCKNGRTCWHLSAANVCEELRTMHVDQVLPARSMSDREIVSELDAMLAADELSSDEWLSVNEVEADVEHVFHESIAGVTDDMVIAPPEKADPQTPAKWAVFDASHAFVVRETFDDESEWVECVRREDALNIAAALNYDPFAAGLPMESNGVTLFVGNLLVGIASSETFAREVCNAWTDAWIPF